ncbi:hypothetical protein Bca101_009862 [Brassica carinata]
MGDAELDTPQYITEDIEVGIFVRTRRAIEEVDLYVSIVKSSLVEKAVDPPRELDCIEAESEEDEGDNCINNDEWHDFAISETPLTIPPTQKNPGGDDQVVPKFNALRNPNSTISRYTIPRRLNGIEIREPVQTIRNDPPVRGMTDKAKNKRPAKDDSDTSSDSDDDIIVPVLGSSMQDTGDRSRPVARRLIFGVSGIPDTAGMDADSGSSSEGTNDVPNEYLVDTALADIQYEGDEIYVGRVFKSKTDCKIKLAIHAMNRKFHFKTPRSSPTMLLAQCVGTACPWRVYAVLLDASGNFQVRQANLIHSCTVDERRNYHKLATTQVIGEILQSRFVGIKVGPTAAAIRKILLDEFHVNVSYWKAWRARELALDHAMGTMVGSYSLMPAYLALLESSNEGTRCFLESEEAEGGERRFKYCFVAYGASISGYAAMRKVVVVDGTSLKGKFGGCLLSAVAQDGNFQVFPLAFAVVNSENDNAWEWFFQKLQTFVFDDPELVFISDRHASISTGLRKVYTQAYHVACVVHLWRNIKVIFKRNRLANLMSAAARAFTINEFNKKFIEIQKISPACAAYLVDLGFEYWTRAHFKGQRYNIMESNIGESWNGVIKEAREYPLITMFEYIRSMVMGWLALRRAKANREKGTLTPNVRKLVEENYELSTGLAVRDIGELEFQVQDSSGECFTVLLAPGSCSCMEYDLIGIPCSHALAASTRIGFPSDALVAPAYYVPTWKKGFAGKIYPVPSVGGLEIGAGTSNDLLPPQVRRPPGRPRKVRILSRGERKQEIPPAGNANVVAVQAITGHPAGTLYKKY